MMDTPKRGLFLGPVPGKGSTLSKGCSTSAPAFSSSVALAPFLKGVGTSEDLIVHPSHEVQIKHFQLGKLPANQTKSN